MIFCETLPRCFSGFRVRDTQPRSHWLAPRREHNVTVCNQADIIITTLQLALFSNRRATPPHKTQASHGQPHEHEQTPPAEALQSTTREPNRHLNNPRDQADIVFINCTSLSGAATNKQAQMHDRTPSGDTRNEHAKLTNRLERVRGVRYFYGAPRKLTFARLAPARTRCGHTLPTNKRIFVSFCEFL